MKLIESPGSAGARSNAERCGVLIESPGSAGARSNAERCGVLIGIALLTVLATNADAGPRVADMVADEAEFAPRPMRRSCNGPSTWAQIVSCSKLIDPSAKVDKQPSAHSQVIASAGSQFKKLYLERGDGKWVLVQGLDLSGHELSERSIVVGNHRVLRVDLHTQQRNAVTVGDLLRVKTVFTCGVPTVESCQQVVTGCAYFQRGHASATFLGDVEIRETGPVVTGDRTHADPFCNR